jgi:uncharacterized protein (TIGR03118 family)
MSLAINPISVQGKRTLALAGVLLPLLVSCGGDHGAGAAAPPATIGTLTVAPTKIQRGQSATLTWSSSNSTGCTGEGAWSGGQAATGTLTVTPAAEGTLTYTLQCFNATGTGSVQQSATLTVTGSVYSATPLVSDMAGAPNQDANLVDPIGLAVAPGFPFWVSNKGSDTSTLYDGTGKPEALVVQLPKFAPTGIVFNGTKDFEVTSAGTTAAAPFIFSGEAGQLAGWGGPGVVVWFPGSTNANYKGLAIGSWGGANYLYATDFHNAKVDVFDGAYALQAWGATAFVDPKLNKGYAPFGIQAITVNGTTWLYVTYALNNGHDEPTVGAGCGFVDIFDTSGKFIKRLIDVASGLNAPWGLALAPPAATDFGLAAGALLVGNFGDGTINEFDPAAGTYWGTLSDSNNKPISYPGLWGIAFGNDAADQPHQTLFFAAGTNDEADGTYGRIDLGPNGPPAP